MSDTSWPGLKSWLTGVVISMVENLTRVASKANELEDRSVNISNSESPDTKEG